MKPSFKSKLQCCFLEQVVSVLELNLLGESEVFHNRDSFINTRPHQRSFSLLSPFIWIEAKLY